MVTLLGSEPTAARKDRQGGIPDVGSEENGISDGDPNHRSP
jgi:hypothetical protein